VLPAYCPDPFHFIEIITSVIAFLKKVCSIIIAKRKRFLTKKEKCINISGEVKSLTEELKNRGGGGDEIKKIDRLISLGKEGFPRKKVLKLFSLSGAFHRRMNDVKDYLFEN